VPVDSANLAKRINQRIFYMIIVNELSGFDLKDLLSRKLKQVFFENLEKR